MRITFQSRDEIERIAEMLQDVFPADIVLDAIDMLDVTSDNPDRLLPWDADGFHLGPLMHIKYPEEKADKKVNKPVDKTVNKAANKKDDKTPHPKQCTSCSYLAGQLDALFYCMREEKLTLADIVYVTGRTMTEIKHLYNLWLQKAGE